MTNRSYLLLRAASTMAMFVAKGPFRTNKSNTSGNLSSASVDFPFLSIGSLSFRVETSRQRFPAREHQHSSSSTPPTTKMLFSLPRSTAIPTLAILLLGTLASFVSAEVCNVCGDPNYIMRNPDTLVGIPPNSFIDLSEATCQQIYNQGLKGRFPGFFCDIIQQRPEIEENCDCGPPITPPPTPTPTDSPASQTPSYSYAPTGSPQPIVPARPTDPAPSPPTSSPADDSDACGGLAVLGCVAGAIVNGLLGVLMGVWQVSWHLLSFGWKLLFGNGGAAEEGDEATRKLLRLAAAAAVQNNN